MPVRSICIDGGPGRARQWRHGPSAQATSDAPPRRRVWAGVTTSDLREGGSKVPTLIAFSGLGGDYILVEEEPGEVARLLDGAEGFVELRRIPAPVSERPIATWVNPARVAFLVQPVQQLRPGPPAER
jgi:hypothetical protein